MIASRDAHRAPESSKNLSSMRRTIPESFSCERTKLRVSHSAARKPFAKEFSERKEPLKKISAHAAELALAPLLALSVAMGGSKESFRYVRTLGSTLLDISKCPAKVRGKRGPS